MATAISWVPVRGEKRQRQLPQPLHPEPDRQEPASFRLWQVMDVGGAADVDHPIQRGRARGGFFLQIGKYIVHYNGKVIVRSQFEQPARAAAVATRTPDWPAMGVSSWRGLVMSLCSVC